MTIKSRHDIKDAIAQRILWCFWTGTSPMSEQRRRCLESMERSTQCNVVLVTQESLNAFISPDRPLHPGYASLSETHRADYLRTYFMHLYGGGYSDIKFQSGPWLPSFEALEARPEMFAVGYKEYSYGVPSYLNTPAGAPLSDHWELLIGNGAYIFRRRTYFTEDWVLGLRKVMDRKLDALRQHPARFPQDTTGAVYQGVESSYPLRWSEVLGDIFHPLCYKYSDKLLNTLPPPVFNDYR